MRRRLCEELRKSGVDAAAVLDNANLRYLTGGSIDYSAALVLIEGDACRYVLVTHVLEGERVEEALRYRPDEVFLYSTYPIESDRQYMLVNSVAEALDRVATRYLDPEKATLGIPASWTRASDSNLLSRRWRVRDISAAFMRSRIVKEADEIELIRQAGEILCRGLSVAEELVRPGVREVDVAAEIASEVMRRGGYLGTYPIVASGPRSALPHGRASTRTIGRGELVVVDIVVGFQGYFADATLTLGTEPLPSELRRLLTVAREAQKHALEMLKPGVRAGDVDSAARRLIEMRGYGRFFPHSTGHGVGVEVHEPPRLAPGNSEVLEAGYVVTVEPGVYIGGKGGARFESTVVLTPKGFEVLTPCTKPG